MLVFVMISTILDELTAQSDGRLLVLLIERLDERPWDMVLILGVRQG
jgi:hypothetical protein